jgi:sugar/nucleoside kinase (ribokinase family)
VRQDIGERLRASRAFDVIGYGEASIDDVWLLRTSLVWGGKVRAGRCERLGGGQVATAMVACARLGLRAAFRGRVGDDADGREVLEGLEAEGVDIASALLGGAPTRHALVLVDRDGERAVVDRGHSSHPPHAVADAPLPDARVLHLDATEPVQALQLAKLARAANSVVSLDIDHPAPGLDALWPLVDICITSRGVAEQVTGEANLEPALRKLAELTGGLVGTTLGADGAALLDDGHLLLSPAFTVAQPLDTTACGDTFRGALLCALVEGQPVAQALRFANAAAAIKTRDLGRRGCPRRAEVNALLASA